MKTSIILLDLTQSLKELESICSEYQIDFNTIKKNKVSGIHLIWIDLSAKQIINYKLNGFDDIKSVSNYLLTIKPVKALSTPIILETDAILDRISQFGIKSLTNEELEFLKNS